MAAQDQSIVDLLKTALSDGQELIRSELVLAKTELRQEMSRIQVGIGAFAGAADGFDSPTRTGRLGTGRSVTAWRWRHEAAPGAPFRVAARRLTSPPVH